MNFLSVAPVYSCTVLATVGLPGTDMRSWRRSEHRRAGGGGRQSDQSVRYQQPAREQSWTAYSAQLIPHRYN